ncbi:MAG: GTP-binding protein [Alphaproteobacteria bacterium]|nr:GTP-binding protein [Alphaproteobacteria bacterium]
MAARITGVPTTIVTGFLGVGKTTAILDLFRHRPAGERWAVLVNEFGEVGIDGALLEGDAGTVVREIPGGCICCSSGVQLQVDLTRLLAEQRPDRLIIEPTGLASPASILDLLRRPWFAEPIAVRAVITLVEPRRFLMPDHLQDDTFLSQVEVADVLVANKTDLSFPEQLEAFDRKAAALWPPKLVVAHTTHGQLDPAWLDLDPSPARQAAIAVDPHLDDDHDHHHHHAAAASKGWVFPPDVVFDWERLRDALQDLAAPGDALPEGVLRIKGVFHSTAAWVLVQGDDTRLAFSPVQYRRDSRVEILAPVTPPPDWEAVATRLHAAIVG